MSTFFPICWTLFMILGRDVAVGILLQHSFDPSQNQCLAFSKYPCSSETNIFSSLSQCKKKCKVGSDPGADVAGGKKYFFSPSTLTCQIYDGVKCEKHNLFTTSIKCQETCISKSPDDCNLPKVVGPCRAAFPRWYFDPIFNNCVKFIYGGCKGNANNFLTQKECLSKCKADCVLPKVSGPCFGAFPRFFYNTVSEICEPFIYGGCQGNANNFETRPECIAKCENRFIPLF